MTKKTTFQPWMRTQRRRRSLAIFGFSASIDCFAATHWLPRAMHSFSAKSGPKWSSLIRLGTSHGGALAEPDRNDRGQRGVEEQARLAPTHRQARSISYRIAGAKFPVLKDIDKFV
jgi:hypothetical protein